MVSYTVQVFTGDLLGASTMDKVYVKLVGTLGESKKATFKGGFFQGSSCTHKVECLSSLGQLVLVELEKKPFMLFSDNDWFCAKIVVTTPEGGTATFPCYRWLVEREIVAFREGTAKRVSEDVNHLALYHRQKEMQKRKEEYRWTEFMQGIPHCMKLENPLCLPAEVRFSFTKTTEFLYTGADGLIELKLKGLDQRKEPWKKFKHMERVFHNKRTAISDYVKAHWKEDEFFAYQFLNGTNPMLIQRCSSLPANFPVTDNMVEPFLEAGTILATELQKGNIFLCDYKMLDGVPTNTVNGKLQFQAAPLCLFYKNPNNKLLPIAIQLKQQPSEVNPIFLPSDSEHDWLLAKIFVRSAEFNEHQLNSHLLRTHLLSEVFTVATLRNLPMVHPLHKLLIPHTRYTLQINHLARLFLIGDKGSFTQFAATGGEGVSLILKRSVSALTYSSLCLPDNIASRGLESIPHFYYRDDGQKLWDILSRFVRGIISYYYPSDSCVQEDPELQSWISEIYTHGFLELSSSGIPQSFSTVEEVIKFVTMVIFTGSAQHGAVNSGQYDFGGWMPNNPFSLQRPPPTTKGMTTESSLLQTLPDVNITVQGMATSWVLSKKSTDFVALGCYPEEHFCEPLPCRLVLEFRAELKSLSEAIRGRNSTLALPYPYLLPEEVENSVAI